MSLIQINSKNETELAQKTSTKTIDFSLEKESEIKIWLITFDRLSRNVETLSCVHDGVTEKTVPTQVIIEFFHVPFGILMIYWIQAMGTVF